MTRNPLASSNPEVPTLTIGGRKVTGTFTKHDDNSCYMRWNFNSFPFSVMITAYKDKVNVVYRMPELGHKNYAADADLQDVADSITVCFDKHTAEMRDWLKRVDAPLNETQAQVQKSTTPDDNMRRFLMRIRDEAAGMGLNIFAVVGGPSYTGASIYHNCGASDDSNAVWNARLEQIAWERRNGHDPDYDWEREYDV